ncbi:Uncharacterised protein [Klebsiella pneumoniae]|nr:Uncharacterised protein [Klebsiella pneumoniae]
MTKLAIGSEVVDLSPMFLGKVRISGEILLG